MKERKILPGPVSKYLVDPEKCRGCEYYCWYGERTCDYTYKTQKIRQGDTAHCKVRKARGRKKRVDLTLAGNPDHAMRDNLGRGKDSGERGSAEG